MLPIICKNPNGVNWMKTDVPEMLISSQDADLVLKCDILYDI
jgi:hypothetical protein